MYLVATDGSLKRVRKAESGPNDRQSGVSSGWRGTLRYGGLLRTRRSQWVERAKDEPDEEWQDEHGKNAE